MYEQFRTNVIIATALQVTRAGVAAVIVAVTLNLDGNIVKIKNTLYVFLMIIYFIAVVVFKISAILIILLCLLIGIMTALLSCRKERA